MVYEVEVLVDWQNVLVGWRRATGNRGRSEIDAQDSVAHLVEHIRFATEALGVAQTRQVTAWVYGSEIQDSRGFGMHVRQALNQMRVSERSLRLTLNPVERPVHSNGELLQVSICPYEAERLCRRDGCGQTIRDQKLADTMIVADAAHFGMFATVGLVVVSDDVDMVPGLLLAAQLRRAAGGNPSAELVWYRPGRGVADYKRKYERHFMTTGGER